MRFTRSLFSFFTVWFCELGRTRFVGAFCSKLWKYVLFSLLLAENCKILEIWPFANKSFFYGNLFIDEVLHSFPKWCRRLSFTFIVAVCSACNAVQFNFKLKKFCISIETRIWFDDFHFSHSFLSLCPALSRIIPVQLIRFLTWNCSFAHSFCTLHRSDRRVRSGVWDRKYREMDRIILNLR